MLAINRYNPKTKRDRVGTAPADHSLLGYVNTYGYLPYYYIDKPFICRDCGSSEIWTAKQQKWWYEIAKGYIHSTAVRCKKCRNILRHKREKQKQHMEEMSKKEPHPNEAFFKNT